MHRIIAATLLALILPLSLFAQSQPPKTLSQAKAEAAASANKKSASASVEELEQQSAQALEEENWVRLYVVNRKLEKLRPWEPRYMIDIVRAAGMLDRKNTAYHYMLAMQRMGLAYDFDQWPETENLQVTEIYNYMNDLMIKAGAPMGTGKTAWELDDAARDFRTLALDEKENRFLLGKAGGEVVALDDKGKTKTLLKMKQGQGAVEGLAVDHERGSLWVSRGDLFEYDLDSLKLRRTVVLGSEEAPERAGPLDVSASGQVYALGLEQMALYRVEPGQDEAQKLPTEELLIDPADLVLSDNDSRLYVADRATGLIMVDTLARLPFKLAGPDNLNMGLVEAVEFQGDQLFIVQTHMSPQRLMRLKLDASGAMVESMAPMAIALEDFDNLGAAVISGDKLFYLANSGTESESDGLRVMETPLDAGDDIVPPDSQALQEALQRQAPPR